MAPVGIYYYANCISCTKALAFIKSLGTEPVEREFFKQRLSADEIRQLFARARLTPSTIVATRSRPFAALELSSRVLTDGEIIDLRAEHPALNRRPVTVKRRDAVVGMNQAKIEALVSN
jgi:arsenate reductase-like glutaredoxin family protein